MGGNREMVEPVDEMEQVGFIVDPKMTMKPMIDHHDIARKARTKLSAIGIYKIKQHLNTLRRKW